jgi:transposase
VSSRDSNAGGAPVETLDQALQLIAELRQELDLTRWQLQDALRRLHGPNSEKIKNIDPAQLEFLVEELASAPSTEVEAVLVEKPEELERPPRQRPVRHPAPVQIETQSVRLEPEEKLCPRCGQEKCVLGESVTVEEDYIPARMIRRQIVRPRLACSRCKEGVDQAPLPARIVEQGRPGPGLVAQVVLAKYVDHTPLYRQEQQFLRLGVFLPRQRLCDWVAAAATLLQALCRKMKEALFQEHYLQIDETPARIMDPEVKGKTHKGYLWVYSTPGGDALFEYSSSRAMAAPQAFLQGFQGHIQSDDYSVYTALVSRNPALKRLGCMAHARRKFFDALPDDRAAALNFLSAFRELYRIEAEARGQGLSHEARYCLRQARAPAILGRIKAMLEEAKPKALPQSPLGKAVSYALNDWPALSAYTENGRWEIDNNLVENALRPVSLGRKNWLFLGHPDAAWRSAVIYSIVVSCQRRRIDPAQYLNDVLRRLPALTNQQLDPLLPANWKPA